MGSYSLSDATAQVVAVLRDYGTVADEQELTDSEVGRFLAQAAAEYSRIRPLESVADVTADGTEFTTLPAGFDPDAGVVLRVECQAGGTWYEVDARSWSLYQSPTGHQLRWTRAAAVASGAAVRVGYTGRRSWGATAGLTTVADDDFYAVCDLGVSFACAALAQKYARTHEPVVNADVVGYRTKAQEWDGRAKAYRAAYERAMGLSDGVAPAGGRLNWDSRGTYADWLTHNRWMR